MRTATVLLSAAIHAGLAVGLITAQESRVAKKKTISVAVTGEKKKEAKPKPPPPPPPVRRAAPKQVALVPKAETVTPVKAAPTPVATNLTMSNEDIGPGIGLQGKASPAAIAAAKTSGPAAVKVASNISERRTQRAREEAGAAGEAACTEEPSKPTPIVQTEINYGLYPQAQQEGLEGKFKARLLIGANGEVVEVQVLGGIDAGFDAAIKAALMRWRFKPAMACGKPVDGGTHMFQARFELAD
jgi:protein TonB